MLPAPPKVDVGWMGGEGAGLREEEVLGDAEELLVVRVSEESRKKAVYIKDLSTSGLHQRPVIKWFTSKTCQHKAAKTVFFFHPSSQSGFGHIFQSKNLLFASPFFNFI